MNHFFRHIHGSGRSNTSPGAAIRLAMPVAFCVLILLALLLPSKADSKSNPKKAEPVHVDTVANQVEEVAEADSLPTSFLAEAFLQIPDRDLDILTQSMRSEMIIYKQERDSNYQIRNIYTGLSWLEDMTGDYLRVHLTDVSNLQLKELPYSKKGKLLFMTIYTVAGEADTADSTIKFYEMGDDGVDSLMEVPAKKFFDLPNPKDFYDIKAGNAHTSGKHLSMTDIMDAMPFHTIAYTIEPGEDNMLTGRLTMSNYMTLETRKQIEPYLRPELQWKWDGKKFRRIK